jgi:tRNA G26 N,N-dimethylase Trm1
MSFKQCIVKSQRRRAAGWRNISRKFSAGSPFSESQIQPSEILEGICKISKDIRDIEQKVVRQTFYNPAQIFNRDLSLLAYLAHINWRKTEFPEKKISFADAFTASGLRAIRAKLELPQSHLDRVVACDLSAEAVEVCKQNILSNGLSTSY